MLELKIDLKKQYGVVLEGGGARGAYQIGVWKALSEAGVRISAIAGASVGALNGAFMCQNQLEKAEKLWSGISYSSVLSGSEQFLQSLMEKREQLVTPGENLSFAEGERKQLFAETVQLVKGGGFDVTPLRKLIREHIDPQKIKESERAFYIVTFPLDEKKELTVDVRDLPEEEIADMLLASAYFPAFRQKKIGGKNYMDGGMVNNVPVDVLAEKGYRDLIVIRIFGIGRDKSNRRLPKDLTVHRIEPSEDLGGMLEFDPKKSRYNMKLGYFDGLRFLYGLCGKKYYFSCDRADAICYDFDAMELLAGELGIERFRIYQPQRFLKLLKAADEKHVKAGERSVFEEKKPDGFFEKLMDVMKV